MPNVNDHGLEVLKKAARDIGAIPKSDYALQVYVVGEQGTASGEGIVKSKKQCDTSISALRVCKATSANTISYADPTAGFLNAQALALSLEAGNFGQEIEVGHFGQVNDGFFNFPLNAPLYLGANGTITDVPPATGQLVSIGHSLGTGAIFLNFKQPITRA